MLTEIDLNRDENALEDRVTEAVSKCLQPLAERMSRLEESMLLLVEQKVVKDWYEVAEAAERLAKRPFTVREWCRHGRIRAEKRKSGRGAHPSWVISHAELLRYQREGLLPCKKAS